MVLQCQRLVRGQVVALEAETLRGEPHSDVVHQRAADQARQSRRLAQRRAEEAGRDDRGPHRVLEPDRVLVAHRVQLLPDRVGEAHLAERIGDLRAGVGRTGQVLQGRRVERLEHRVGDLRLVQGPLPGVLRRARGHFLEVPDVGDLASRGDAFTARRDQIPGEDGACQREVGHADALL